MLGTGNPNKINNKVSQLLFVVILLLGIFARAWEADTKWNSLTITQFTTRNLNRKE